MLRKIMNVLSAPPPPPPHAPQACRADKTKHPGDRTSATATIGRRIVIINLSLVNDSIDRRRVTINRVGHSR